MAAKALVTGGAGFIGSHLCRRLVSLGSKVTCLDNLSSGRQDHVSDLFGKPNFKFARGDLLNIADLRNALHDIDVVFHLAARVGVKHYVEDPLDVIKTNVHGTDNLLEMSLKAGVKRFVFASTSEIYGRNPNVPLNEDSERVLGPPTIDRWCYSSSKAVDEHLCNAYYKKHELPIVILRYFNVYGPNQETSDYGGVVSIFIHQVLQDKPPLVYGDGNQTRSFTYVEDVLDATIRASEKESAIGETFNIGREQETTINDLARLVISLAGKSGQISPKHVPYDEFYGSSYEDIPRRTPVTTKAKEILGVQPRTTLEEGLGKTIEWYQRHLHRT